MGQANARLLLACIFAILRICWDGCLRRESSSIARKMDHVRFWIGSTNCLRRCKTGCYLRLERLREMGHELRRPEADYLRDGIYELRVSLRGVHHRILYFFNGAIAAVVSHGLVKEQVVPPKEIDRAIERKKRFVADPVRHTHEEV